MTQSGSWLLLAGAPTERSRYCVRHDRLSEAAAHVRRHAPNDVAAMFEAKEAAGEDVVVIVHELSGTIFPSASYDGIGSGAYHAVSGRGTISVPLN